VHAAHAQSRSADKLVKCTVRAKIAEVTQITNHHKHGNNHSPSLGFLNTKTNEQQTNNESSKQTKQAKQTTAKPSNRPASSQQQKQNTTKNTIDCRARGQCHPALFLLLLLGSFVIFNPNKNNQQQKQISEPVEEIGI